MAPPIDSCARLGAAVELLGKRWTLLIVELLLQRPARFCELRRALPRISERVLSERLSELTGSGLATREVGPRVPRMLENGLLGYGTRILRRSFGSIRSLKPGGAARQPAEPVLAKFLRSQAVSSGTSSAGWG